MASGDLKAYGNSKLDDLDKAKTRRGFTDHEHLDDVEFIHMNGRVYDYNLGRFMSVDPIIQSPTNSQSINPYSYIMNNPLSGTDPTGYASCSVEDPASCEEVAESLGKEEKANITQKQSVTGSRIKRDVKVGTMTGNGNGTVNIQIGNMSATADIGAPSSTSKGTGGVAGGYIDQQKANRGQTLGDFGANLDDDNAALNHDPSDWGQTAMTHSNLYVGKHDTEALLSGKLTQADLYNRAEMYGTVASFVPIGFGARVVYSAYASYGIRNSWGVANGANQGIKHYFQYLKQYPDRIPSIAKSLGINPTVFSNSRTGFKAFTEQAQLIIRQGNVRYLENGRSAHFMRSTNGGSKGVMVIQKSGKIQSVMRAKESYFKKVN
ncbi:RHS repeat domain-containing protein [Pseudoalteromonas sp. SaAl2]